MRKLIPSFFILLLCTISLPVLHAQQKLAVPPGFKMDTRIDNMGYWQKCAEMGLTPVQPNHIVEKATFTGTRVFNADGVMITDSPDVPVTTEVATQSENSVVVDPNNKAKVLNSNNSTPQPSTGSLYGADYYMSADEGETWTGSKQGAGGANSGDPAACINLTGRYFIGYIDGGYGQSVSYSDNQGQTWIPVKVANGTMFNMLDKNHLWVDISPASPYKGNLYDAWMASNQIKVSRSITNGTSWEAPISISAGTNAGSHNQGLNFKCGPDGEVYCVWAVYDSWPSDEKALGFSKSADGGITWGTAVRIIDNIRGIRTTGVSQNMRTNSFPSMACDLSNGPNHGALYAVWANIGVPGVNTGTDVDVYMIKSTDQGTSWSTAKKINTDASGLGKKHYFPWIACDQTNGNLSIVYYDNRNVTSAKLETYVAYSTDGGNTFTDLKVSDVSFTPSPIPNMASSYMGDYLGISAYNGKVYPCWTDNRLGYCMTYVSPLDMTMPAPLVVYNANTLNDTTFGNGNGKMDYGEIELLGLKLKNEGTVQADSVAVTLTSESPYITMIDSTEFYGNFAIGGVRNINNAFKFKVSDSVPHGLMIPFLVKAKDKTDSTTISTFSIFSHAPAVTILSMVIEDPLGNNNGRLDPGETATLKILTKNTGDYNAINAISELTSSNPFITIASPVQTLGTLIPGQEVLVSFDVMVNPATAIGTATVFHNYAHSVTQSDRKDWLVKIGLIIEDWETGDFSKFAWQFAGAANWVIDTTSWEKIYAAKSGLITNSQTSELYLNYNVMYNDTISFYRKTDSENTNDKLEFFIDNAMVGQWSGNQAYRKYQYPVLAGPHTFKWVYEKNATVSTGKDAAWIDYINFPPEYKINISSGGNSTACGGNPYNLHGAAVNYDSLQWSTSGTGTFLDPALPNTTYTPSAQDIAAGSVILTLTGWGNNGQPTASAMTLTFEPAPTVSAGPDQHNCIGSTVSLSTSEASNYTSLQWSTTGNGSFDDFTVLHPIYTPGSQDIQSGSVKLALLNIPSSASCFPISDTLLVSISPVPHVNLGADTVVCANLQVTLDATVVNGTSYNWSNGASTPVITVDSTGTGIGFRYFTVSVTDQTTCSATDSIKITFKNCTGINEIASLGFNYYPNPSNGSVTMEFNSGIAQTIHLRILSAQGVSVFTDNFSVTGSLVRKIDLKSLAQGTYLLELTNGKEKMLKKLVIQK